VSETLKLKISSRVTDQIREFELTSLESLAEGTGGTCEGISLTLPKIELNPTTPIMPSNLISKWASFREAKAVALREAAANLRKSIDEANTLIQVGAPLSECEKIVQSAQNSLSDDLTRFFGNAELYRAGVFSHTTKDSIGALGLGKELDNLESEFSEGDRAPFTADAIQSVFPNSAETASDVRTRMAAIDKRLRPLLTLIKDLKIPSPEGNQRQLGAILEVESSSLIQAVFGELRDDVGLFLGKIEAKLSGIAVEKRRAYEMEIAGARQTRRFLYAMAFVGGSIVGVLSYLAYRYAVDIPQNTFHSVVWNIVAQLIWAPVAFAVAKGIDKFPRRSAMIRHEYQAMLRRELERTADEELRTHDFAAINPQNLAKRLSRAYHSLIDSDPDSWNLVAADRLNTLRELHSEFTAMRGEYVNLIETAVDKISSYFSGASKNLQLLNAVADRIKARAIEPSFKLLADTQESLDRIKKQVHEVEFG
jgi:hypothetical protein